MCRRGKKVKTEKTAVKILHLLFTYKHGNNEYIAFKVGSDHYQILSSCYLRQMKAKLKISVHLHMGNYVNQVHHTINTGESREVKIKINFA